MLFACEFTVKCCFFSELRWVDIGVRGSVVHDVTAKGKGNELRRLLVDWSLAIRAACQLRLGAFRIARRRAFSTHSVRIFHDIGASSTRCGSQCVFDGKHSTQEKAIFLSDHINTSEMMGSIFRENNLNDRQGFDVASNIFRHIFSSKKHGNVRQPTTAGRPTMAVRNH